MPNVSPTSGPLMGDAGIGFSTAYEADLPRAEKELAETLAGPQDKPAGPPADDVEMKNPEGEFQDPAPFVGQPDPDRPTHSDPEGHQGGVVANTPAERAARSSRPTGLRPDADDPSALLTRGVEKS